MKLRIELVPKPLWGRNLRSREGLGKARWDKFRQELIRSNGGRCAICGSGDRLHGHEVWGYREKKTVGTAVLLAVEIVCMDCHDIHHWARTTQLFRAGIIKHGRYGALSAVGWVEPLQNPSFTSPPYDGYCFAPPILRAYPGYGCCAAARDRLRG